MAFNAMKQKILLTVFIALLLVAPVAAVADTVSAEEKYAFTSFYDQLDSNQRGVYTALAAMNPENLESTINLTNPIHTVLNTPVPKAKEFLMKHVKNIVTGAHFALKMEKPLAFPIWGNTSVDFGEDMQTFLNDGKTIGLDKIVIKVIVDPAYADNPTTIDKNELREKVDALRAAVDNYNVGSSDTRTMVGNINNYLINRLKYDPDAKDGMKADPYAHDAYGALVSDKKLVVCDGFSHAFQALCQKYRIECMTILGYSLPSMEGHAWNAVKMGNDKWYPVDVTWNQKMTDKYLLKDAASFNAEHVAGTYPHDGGYSFDYPVFEATKYDKDPWYISTYIEYAFYACIGALVIGGLVMILRQDKNKSRRMN